MTSLKKFTFFVLAKTVKNFKLTEIYCKNK